AALHLLRAEEGRSPGEQRLSAIRDLSFRRRAMSPAFLFWLFAAALARVSHTLTQLQSRFSMDRDYTARMSSKFTITVPKAVRERTGWVVGQEFAFVPRGKGFVIVAVPTLEELRGMFKGADNSDIRDRNDRY